MKIYRNNGEIELTNEELMAAHEEYQHICDIEDVRTVMEEEDLAEEYGIAPEDMERITESAAEFYRGYLELNDWFEDARNGIDDAIREYTKEAC